MPFSPLPAAPGRIGFDTSLTSAEVRALAADPQLKVLQTRGPVEPGTWDRLNDVLLAQRPEVELRVYGFYSTPCDLSFVQRLPRLVNFSADCLMQADGVEHIGALPHLQRLCIGIHSLESFDFLDALPAQNLRGLSLLATRSKRPDLRPVGRFTGLRRLYLEGQQKNIGSLAALHALEELTLRSVTLADLGFLRALPQLWSLDIKLGGTRHLGALEGMAQLKYLELWQITGLADVSVMGSLTGLQHLFLQSLRNVTALPDLSRLGALRRLYLENMKGLTNVAGIATAPVLEEFIHVSSTLHPADYAALLRLPSLKRVLVGMGSDKKNTELQEMARAQGLEKYQYREFVYA